MNNIDKIKSELEQFGISSMENLEQFRLKFLAKKSELQELLSEIKNVAPEERKSFGQQVNELKQKAQQLYEDAKTKMEMQSVSTGSQMDVTRPSTAISVGSMHPISIMMNEVCEIFEKIGFSTVSGPDVEDDWHVFTALNFPEEHPARDMQDTFFVELHPDILLRTHTSSLQVRTMEKQQPPIRVICPGRVFRNEAITSRAHCIFHQVEGLYIAENVSFAEMKQTLLYFAQQMFGNETKIRLRPSYFPFTEPSAEMDISCNICGGSGCALCKHTGWVEILGCGMVDPSVLENCGIDSKKYTGYAFGLGIERMTMLKYRTNDIRLYFENDVRFLRQFKAAGN
ncbi:MAG: phenylalanine--tRNA ligase subunit alpha [Bacteroidales bacterium]|nr:phenylalanine--tRNA ligase subunit alpha [Bacteroidota bacterium]MBQ9510007.1 phenylalanine--tRNA ligase subunit alpha [Bacteroidales bacterium]MBR6063581.1 phenylalanine--tRNA ligase subunit alpha [Bacteroidales bacterium]